jgi:hypothetical protein
MIHMLWLLVLVTVTGGCVDEALPPTEPIARVVVAWDIRACDPRVRVHVELEDDAGTMMESSVPCAIGQVTLDVDAWGIYLARVWGERDEQRMRFEVDAPVARFVVDTPR